MPIRSLLQRRRFILLFLCLSLAAAGCIAAKLLGPLIGKTPFRSLSTRIAEGKTNDAPTTAPLIAAEDWPGWRGPRGDGISRETQIAEGWPADGLKRLWSAEVGLGYSSPIAAEGRVYQFSLNDRRDALTCFDARSGHILWNDESDSGWSGDFPGTRATPTIDGGAIYTFGGAGDLIRRDIKTGKPAWHVNVLATTGAKAPGYGCGSSPLVAMGKVFVQVGQGGPLAVAIDAQSGAVAWQSESRAPGAYAHPILIEVPGSPVPQLVVFGGDGVYGMNPSTGQALWAQPWATSYGVNSSTPVYSPADGRLFITSNYGMGCAMLQISGAESKMIWKNKEVKSKFQQTILDGGYLYANSGGRLKCLNWTSGSRQWEATSEEVRTGENGSICRVGDKLLVMSDSGAMSLVRATPAGYKVLGTFPALDASETWATPLIYGGRIFVKGTKELVCFDAS